MSVSPRVWKAGYAVAKGAFELLLVVMCSWAAWVAPDPTTRAVYLVALLLLLHRTEG